MKRLKRRLAHVPILSLVLLKLCRRGTSSVVYAEWRWKRCPSVPDEVTDA